MRDTNLFDRVNRILGTEKHMLIILWYVRNRLHFVAPKNWPTHPSFPKRFCQIRRKTKSSSGRNRR